MNIGTVRSAVAEIIGRMPPTKEGIRDVSHLVGRADEPLPIPSFIQSQAKGVLHVLGPELQILNRNRSASDLHQLRFEEVIKQQFDGAEKVLPMRVKVLPPKPVENVSFDVNLLTGTLRTIGLTCAFTKAVHEANGKLALTVVHHESLGRFQVILPNKKFIEAHLSAAIGSDPDVSRRVS